MARSLMLQSVVALSCIVVLAPACSERPTQASPLQSSPIAVANAQATAQAFAWLAPLGTAGADPATFDASAAPVVEICAWTSGACVGPPIVRFSTTPAGSVQPLLVNSAAGRYEADWSLLSATFTTRKTYRIRVLQGAAEIGAISVDVVRGRWALTRNDGTLAPLVSANAIAVRFGITRPLVEATKTIDAQGGQILLTDGTELTVPAGALVGPQTIRITRLDNHSPAPSLGLGVLATAWRFEPEGLNFAKPVTVRFASSGFLPAPAGFSPSDLVLVHFDAGASNLDILEPKYIASNFVEAEITHFSTVAPQYKGRTGPLLRWRTTGDKWIIPTIEWYLEPVPALTPTILTQSEITAALAQWEGTTNAIRFHQTSVKSEANIIFVESGHIGFGTGCNNAPFTDLYGITCFPRRTSFVNASWGAADQIFIHLASESIALNVGDLRSSLLHEIGHAIGIAHSPSWFWTGPPDAPVMNACQIIWTLLGCEAWYAVTLRPEDVAAAQDIYPNVTQGISILASGLSYVFAISRSGSTLAFTDYSGGAVYRTSTNGGVLTTLASGLPSSGPAGIVNDGTNVYWLEVRNASGASLGAIKKISLAGGPITTLASGIPDMGAPLQSDGNSLYFYSLPSIRKIDKTGGPITSVVSSNTADGPAFTLNNGILYFIDQGRIKRVSTSGGPVTTMTTGATTTSDLLVVGTTLYWINGFTNSCCTQGIFSVSTSAVSTVPNQRVFTSSLNNLASDGTSLYARGIPGVIRYSLPNFSTATTLATFGGNGGGYALAVDAQSVYWSHFGTVFKGPK